MIPKTAFVLLSFFCSTLFLNAQTSTEKWDKYSEIAFNYYDSDKGKWVEKIVPSENGYSKETIFIERVLKKIKADFYFIRVKKKDKYGWTNVSGELLIPIEYDGGVFGAMRSKLICVKKKEKWGCIDFKNNIVVPFAYDKMSSFKDNLCQVTLNGKMGFIDNKGVEVIKPVYDKTEEFVNGAAVVMKDNKYGFIDKKGTVIGPISYDGAFSFDEFKLGYVKVGTKYGVIDSTGKLLFSDEFQEVPVALNSELFKVRKNFSYGVMTKTGKLVIDYKYMSIFKPRPDGNGSLDKVSDIILRVRCGALWGFVKADGTIVTECIFSNAEEVFRGQAQVEMHADAITKKGTYYFDTKSFQVDVEVPDPVVVEPLSNSRGKGTQKSGASEKKSCLILNDLTQAQLDGKNTVKLGFTGFKMATTFIPRGKTLEVDCDDVWVYRLQDQNSTERVKGYDLFNTKGRCGETIKLSDYW